MTTKSKLYLALTLAAAFLVAGSASRFEGWTLKPLVDAQRAIGDAKAGAEAIRGAR